MGLVFVCGGERGLRNLFILLPIPHFFSFLFFVLAQFF